MRAATTTPVDIEDAPASFDGYSPPAGSRILVKNQSNAAENGIYLYSTVGNSMTRAPDADASAEVTPGMFVFVEQGATQADTGWVLTTDAPITVGGTPLVFSQFSGAGTYTAGLGLTQSGTTFNVGNGLGIKVAADLVEIDTDVVVRKYATNVGNGSATSFVVTHNLNTQDVIVKVRDNASPFAFMEPDVEATSANTVTVRFATAPTTNQYRVVIHA